MQIRCPFCEHRIVVKGARAGGYRPACPRCQQHYVMVIAMVEGHRLVLLGKSLETLAPLNSTALAQALGQSAAPTPPLDAEAARAPQAGAAQPTATQATAAQVAVAPTATQTAVPATPAAPPTTSTDGAPARSGSRARPPMPERLDGYEIQEMLGEGGMGAVYLARQLSLDRAVAIKTIRPELADNSAFLSRFTREAYAAAQLSHHNVVQIFDIGEDAGTHYFSMEYVAGRSLADHLRAHGALDVEEAAGYVLQAARGLKFAHDHAMVHRDVKPANLLLNDQGVIKLADLGLVKTTPREEGAVGRDGVESQGDDPRATAPQAMGTPAYMAPEQAQDAGHVDGRADIYSLGCTFYALTTGRPMFEGTTAAELITKHTSEPVMPPEQIVQRVPQSISAIIMKMVAKQPQGRYPTADDLIAALESFLGIAAGPFTPREEHANALEQAVHSFNDAPLAKLRRWLAPAFALACAVLFVLGVVAGPPTLAAGAITLGLLTGVSYTVLTGITQRTFLFRKLRQLVFGSRPREWVAWSAAALGVAALIVLLNLHGVVLATGVLGVVLAAAVHFGLDPLVTRSRRPHVDAVRDLLKSMRLRGLEEDALRRFVCRYSGRHWEAFYEALFGYEAKMQARRLWGTDDEGRPRARHGGWRDGLIHWIDQKQQQRESERQRRHLQRIEARRLKAEGKSDVEAAREADRTATAMVHTADEYKRTGDWRHVAKTVDAAAPRGASSPTISDQPTTAKRRGPITYALDLALGGRGRFVAGVVLMALYALWMRQNNLAATFDTGAGLDALRRFIASDGEAVRLPGVPTPDAAAPVLEALSRHAAGLAGALLVLAAFSIGRRMSFYMLPAVAVLLAGPLVIEQVLTLPELPVVSWGEVILVFGGALGGVGLWLGRRHRQM